MTLRKQNPTKANAYVTKTLLRVTLYVTLPLGVTNKYKPCIILKVFVVTSVLFNGTLSVYVDSLRFRFHKGDRVYYRSSCKDTLISGFTQHFIPFPWFLKSTFTNRTGKETSTGGQG